MDRVEILWHYVRTKCRPEFQSRSGLEAWQMRRFQAFARKTLSKSPFYRPYVGQPLADYPSVDKSVMVANFDIMNTRQLRREAIMKFASSSERTRDFKPLFGDISVGLSSGTSGTRGLFAVSPGERRHYVGAALAKCLPGSVFGRYRIALLLRANNTLYEEVGKGGRISFRYFDLIRPFAEICHDLEEFRPDILIGPPQTLCLVADAQAVGRLGIRPQKILSSAEVLDASDCDRISQTFGVAVDQIYQATEGFLGVTCRHGTIHLNEEFIHFEKHWIDREGGRFMPIVTDFTRTTQPIVRYRLDDILVERKTPCPCGSIRTGLSRIEGRFDDILAVPSRQGGRLIPVMPDYIRDALAHDHGLIADYRVIQKSVGHIDIQLASSDSGGAFSVARERVSAVLERFGASIPTIRNAGPVAHDPMRKVRRIERQFAVVLEDMWPGS